MQCTYNIATVQCTTVQCTHSPAAAAGSHKTSHPHTRHAVLLSLLVCVCVCVCVCRRPGTAQCDGGCVEGRRVWSRGGEQDPGPETNLPQTEPQTEQPACCDACRASGGLEGHLHTDGGLWYTTSHSTAQHSTTQHNTTQYNTAQHSPTATLHRIGEFYRSEVGSRVQQTRGVG